MTTAPDMTAACAPRSDQLNAEDLLTGPQTITVTAVTRGTAEQPVDIVTEEYGPGRPYKPSKTMRRVIMAAWGTNTASYTGRRMTIYRDPEVMFGRDKVGGIKISHLSHIDKRLELALTVTRGKRASFSVEPLADAPAAITDADVTEFEKRIASAETLEQLGAVAADLKARDLGSYHKILLSAWSDRKAVIATQVPGQDGGNDAGQGAEPSSGSALWSDSRDQEPAADTKPASRQQITRLKAIRQAEKWEADDEWHAYIKSSTGADVTSESELTEAQAQKIIDEFAGN
jgi:hypothetical protein